jgi:hypothetical protein
MKSSVKYRLKLTDVGATSPQNQEDDGLDIDAVIENPQTVCNPLASAIHKNHILFSFITFIIEIVHKSYNERTGVES